MSVPCMRFHLKHRIRTGGCERKAPNARYLNEEALKNVVRTVCAVIIHCIVGKIEKRLGPDPMRSTSRVKFMDRPKAA
jgi:hypothetical protein